MNAGFVIPVYNHGRSIRAVVDSLAPNGLPIIIVDDGNDGENRALIEDAARSRPLVSLVKREKNGGKGRAMRDGMLKARALGLSHAFQIDSDGQHDAGRVPFFLERAREFPDCVICGFPEFDATAPKSRRHGREISNRWARFVGMTNEIKDAMCGFRVYPVAPYCELLDSRAVIDSRMGYDADILVHLAWKGLRVKNYPVRVTYPTDGVSNFRIVRDNIHIALSFTRLCVEMFARFPFAALQKKSRGPGYA